MPTDPHTPLLTIARVKATDEPNLVSSFKSAFIGSQGTVSSVCIKYAMFAGSTRLSYWPQNQFLALYRCIEHYSGVHYYGSDLQRMSDDPGFAVGLPKRHPIHTMARERPDLTESDYLKSQNEFSVASFVVVDKGGACCVQCTFTNGFKRTDVLPAYVAMNLCGALKASIDMSGLMTAPPAGSA
jgi:hypothetical protein